MAAGIHARSQGRTVVLVERGVIGGTCLNVGCVPSKTLIAASGQRERALHSPFGGVRTSARPVDLASVVAQKDLLVGAMRQAKYVDVAAAHGFEVRTGQANFAGPDVLLVDGDPLPAAVKRRRGERCMAVHINGGGQAFNLNVRPRPGGNAAAVRAR